MTVDNMPVDSFLITGGAGRFPQILDLFQNLKKMGLQSGCSEETLGNLPFPL